MSKTVDNEYPHKTALNCITKTNRIYLEFYFADCVYVFLLVQTERESLSRFIFSSVVCVYIRLYRDGTL